MTPEPKTAREKYIGKIANDKSLKIDALAPKTPTEKYLKEIAEKDPGYTLEDITKFLFSDGGNFVNFASNPQTMGLYSALVWIGDNVPSDQPEDWPESMDVIFDGVSYTIPRYAGNLSFDIAYGYATVDEIGEEIPDFSQAPIMFNVMYDLQDTLYQYGLVFVTNSTESSHSVFISYKTKEAVPSKEFEEARGFVANKVMIIPEQIVKSGDTLLANVTEFSEIAQKLGELPPLWITYNGETIKAYSKTNNVGTIFYPVNIDEGIDIDQSNLGASFHGMLGEKLISAYYVEEPEVDPDFIEASLKANEPFEIPANLESTLVDGGIEFRGNVFVSVSELLKLFKSGRRIVIKASTSNNLFLTTELTANGNDVMLSGFTFMRLPNGSNSYPAGIATYVIPYHSDSPDDAVSTVGIRLYTLTPLALD